jgi:hypothetical protein
MSDHSPTAESSDHADSWAVYRIDDNANVFLVRGGLTRFEADRLAAEFRARGHKQTYLVEREASRVRPPGVQLEPPVESARLAVAHVLGPRR